MTDNERAKKRHILLDDLFVTSKSSLSRFRIPPLVHEELGFVKEKNLVII